MLTLAHEQIFLTKARSEYALKTVNIMLNVVKIINRIIKIIKIMVSLIN